ncbi:hypothetical protein sos41_30470 [Alphaproteobacteria bacterium SO-S41]|nr:hypothetical protein sos41_30470 [Alphaproteobacteria bacterium SO-S41]
MSTGPADGIRFSLELPSRTEPRRYKVRPVAEADAGAVADLLRHGPGINRHKPPTQSPNAMATCLGVYDEMRVLRGIVELRAGAPTPDCCFIELMVIDPRYRRAGMGAALVAELATRLKQSGAERFAIEVDDDNDLAAKFWLRQGFVETGARGERRSFEKAL